MNNAPEFPFVIKPGKRDDQLILDWKYADATWFDLMRIHRIAYLTRFTIWVDESDHVVRVREYQSQFDGSGSPTSLNLQFKAQWGIDFYNFRHETVYGVQVENGLPVPKLSYTYKFDINEMREPLHKLVVENGWTYKGVVMFAKWLTG
ncbi:hypothetical protein [Pusillimonas sp. ANT_WB101]|uniref:hypothetical protein n=1 Tax=Pusillimonas sp. ANT_WB101 TaxID=2597356 RepID=UPI00125A62B0|nr:hypothetical protein [Pusillimonas sp. ANT_WB101]KAA0911154.1 hypothetical protein FQ179_04700 [Pusillimonas sp. ANT_WB101]